MPSTRSSAATKCISEVPGLVKQTSTPPATRVWTRLSAPFILAQQYRTAMVPRMSTNALTRRSIAHRSAVLRRQTRRRIIEQLIDAEESRDDLLLERPL